MENLFYTDFTSGGRISTPKFRATLQDIDEPEGLSSDVDRYALLTLVKRVGKAFGFSPRMIQLLDYYMSFTRECDWQAEGRPIVFQSVSKTALDFGLSERQIQKLENALFKIGALSWNDSGNHRRYGRRDEKTGHLLYAFGVDLTPLAALETALRNKLEEKQLYEKAWQECKRKISWYRRQIRSLIAELSGREGGKVISLDAQRSYDEISTSIRAYMDLPKLQAMMRDHKTLFNKLLTRFQHIEIMGLFNSLSQQNSCIGEQKFAHLETTIQPPTNKLVPCNPSQDLCFQESVPQASIDQSNSEEDCEDRNDPVTSSGLQHITFKQAHGAASQRFLDHLFMSGNLAPLSFISVPDATYTHGLLGVYELNRIDLIKDMFLWAYEKSSARYVALRQTLGEPDPFRLRYRAALRDIVSSVILQAMEQISAAQHIANWTSENIDEIDRARFIEAAETELLSLHEGNFARYAVRPSEYDAWRKVWER